MVINSNDIIKCNKRELGNLTGKDIISINDTLFIYKNKNKTEMSPLQYSMFAKAGKSFKYLEKKLEGKDQQNAVRTMMVDAIRNDKLLDAKFLLKHSSIIDLDFKYTNLKDKAKTPETILEKAFKYATDPKCKCTYEAAMMLASKGAKFSSVNFDNLFKQTDRLNDEAKKDLSIGIAKSILVAKDKSFKLSPKQQETLYSKLGEENYKNIALALKARGVKSKDITFNPLEFVDKKKVKAVKKQASNFRKIYKKSHLGAGLNFDLPTTIEVEMHDNPLYDGRPQPNPAYNARELETGQSSTPEGMSHQTSTKSRNITLSDDGDFVRGDEFLIPVETLGPTSTYASLNPNDRTTPSTANLGSNRDYARLDATRNSNGDYNQLGLRRSDSANSPHLYNTLGDENRVTGANAGRRNSKDPLPYTPEEERKFLEENGTTAANTVLAQNEPYDMPRSRAASEEIDLKPESDATNKPDSRSRSTSTESATDSAIDGSSLEGEGRSSSTSSDVYVDMTQGPGIRLQNVSTTPSNEPVDTRSRSSSDRSTVDSAIGSQSNTFLSRSTSSDSYTDMSGPGIQAQQDLLQQAQRAGSILQAQQVSPYENVPAQKDIYVNLEQMGEALRDSKLTEAARQELSVSYNAAIQQTDKGRAK